MTLINGLEDTLKQLRYLNKYLRHYKLRLGLGILFVGASVFFSVLIPSRIGQALDHILSRTKDIAEFNGESYMAILGDDILRFSLMILGLSVLSGIFMYLMRKTIIVMSRLIEYDLRKEIYEHYQKLDTGFYKRNKVGDLMSRISEDVSKVRMYLGPAILYGIRVAFLFTFVIFCMFSVSTTLTLYTLLPLPFLSLSIYYVSSIINKKSAVIQAQVAKINSIAQETYAAIRIVKSYVRESEFQSYFKEQSEIYRLKSLELARVQALFFPLMILLVSLSTLLTIYIGGKLVVQGEIQPGNIAEFVIYINMLTWPITSIGWIASIIQQAEASQARINEILTIKSEITTGVIPLADTKGQLTLENVSFTYPDTGITAIKNISFQINPGERIAIVGRTAAGKSTLAELILRLYDTTEGTIKVDGTDIRELSLHDLRSRIGYVPQNVFLFSDSIANNIAFGNNETDQDAVHRYADVAAIKEDILSFSEGFETQVGERGVTLSGGQKQRISIARALIKEPDIIILDDCLSAIDANTEHKILAELDGALEGKTTLIITHRISNLMTFDRIFVLEEGALRHIGNHEELMALDGYYKHIVDHQFGEQLS